MDEHEQSKDKPKTTCIIPDLRKAQSDIARGLDLIKLSIN